MIVVEGVVSAEHNIDLVPAWLIGVVSYAIGSISVINNLQPNRQLTIQCVNIVKCIL